MVRQAMPLKPMEVHSGADLHLQPRQDPTTEQGDASEGGCDPVGNLCWSRLLAGPVDHLMERIHSGAVCEELQPLERTHVGQVQGEQPPTGGIPCWNRGRVWGVLLRRKEQQRRVMN